MKVGDTIKFSQSYRQVLCRKGGSSRAHLQRFDNDIGRVEWVHFNQMDPGFSYAAIKWLSSDNNWSYYLDQIKII
jgi:hypothetical protein